MPKTSSDEQLLTLQERILSLFAKLYVLPARVQNDDHPRVIETELFWLRIPPPSAVLHYLKPTLMSDTGDIGDKSIRFPIRRIYCILAPGLLRTLGRSSFLEQRPDSPEQSDMFLCAYLLQLNSRWVVIDVARGRCSPCHESGKSDCTDEVRSVPLGYLRPLTEPLEIPFSAAQLSGHCRLYGAGPNLESIGFTIPTWNFNSELSAWGEVKQTWDSLHDMLWERLRRRMF